MDEENNRPCRNDGCEFSGSSERDYYCSQCYKQKMDAIIGPGLGTNLFGNVDEPAPIGFVLDQPRREPKQSEEGSKKCTRCHEFFGSPEYGGRCHGCFLKMTSATDTEQPGMCISCGEFFGSPEYGGCCHDCFMKRTEEQAMQPPPRDSPRETPHDIPPTHHESSFDSTFNRYQASSQSHNNYRPINEPIYGNINTPDYTRTGVPVYENTTTTPDLPRMQNTPDPQYPPDPSFNQRSVERDLVYMNENRPDLPILPSYPDPSRTQKPPDPSFNQRSVERDLVYRPDLPILPSHPDPSRTQKPPEPSFRDRPVMGVPVYGNIPDPSRIQNPPDPSRGRYPSDPSVRHYPMETPIHGIVATPDPSVRRISDPPPTVLPTSSNHPVPAPRRPRSVKTETVKPKIIPEEGHDLPAATYTEGKYQPFSTLTSADLNKQPSCFMCDSNEPITILNVVCQQHALQIRQNSKMSGETRYETHPIVDDGDRTDQGTFSQYPMTQENRSRADGHLSRVEGGASGRGGYWRDPYDQYRTPAGYTPSLPKEMPVSPYDQHRPPTGYTPSSPKEMPVSPYDQHRTPAGYTPSSPKEMPISPYDQHRTPAGYTPISPKEMPVSPYDQYRPPAGYTPSSPKEMAVQLEPTPEDPPVKMLCRSVGCSFYPISEFGGYCKNCFQSQY